MPIKYLPGINRYTAEKLADDKNYISTKDALPMFPFLKGKNSQRIVVGWIKKGYLFGRCRNLAAKRSRYGNRWEVFVPDIKRFKKDRIKVTNL